MSLWGTPVPSVRYKGTAPTHPTDNLGVQSKDWRTPGAYAAVDIMAPVGTPVVAAEDGVVYKLGSAQGGVSLSLKGRSGADHWYGHLGGYFGPVKGVTSSNPLRVRRGQLLGFIGPHPNGAHLHYGVMGANAAQIASTPQGAPSGVGGAGLGNLPEAIIRGQIKPEDLPPGSTVRPTWGTLPGTGGTTVRDIVDVVKTPAEAIKWIWENWDRVAMVLGGFVLLLVGLILLGRALGMGSMGRAGKAVASIDPLEAAYKRGEEDWLRTEARRAGRRAAAQRAPSAQGGLPEGY